MTLPRSRVRRAGLALLSALLAARLPAPAYAQDPADSTADTSAVRSTRRAQKTFFTRRDAIASGIALAGVAGVAAFDVRIARWTQQPNVQGDSSRRRLVTRLTRINETPLTIGAVATYALGRLARSATVTDIGLHLSEAIVLTDAVSEALRAPIGRARPRVSPDDAGLFSFGKGFTAFDHRAFPSLHSAAAFATAAALVGEIRERRSAAVRYAAPLLYGAAAVPGLTRMYLNQHWASDIVAGAFLGTLLGSRVVHYGHSHGPSRLERALGQVSVAPLGDGRVLLHVSLARQPGT